MVFERLDGFAVLDTNVVLDVVFKNNQRVGVLFGATHRAFVIRFKPGHDTAGMKCVRTRKSFGAVGIEARHRIKTDGTCLRMMYTALPVDERRAFALSPVHRQRRTCHIT